MLNIAAPSVTDERPKLNPLALRGSLRDIRAEAQDIGRSLEAVRQALATPDLAARNGAVQRVLEDLSITAAASHSVVELRQSRLQAILASDSALYDEYGDVVLTVENLWARLIRALPTGYSDHVVVQSQVDAASKLLGDLAWQVGLATIPYRLNDHLLSLGVGGSLDFAAMFSDELPDPAQQKLMLAYLAAHPAFVEGVIDIDRGVIYRSSRSPWRRLLSYGALLILVGPGGYAVVKVITDGVSWLGLPSGWFHGSDPTRFNELLGAYVLLVIGAVFHVGIEAIKQGQRANPGAFTAIGDWLTWILVREVAIASSIVVLLLTFVGLAYWLPVGQLNGQTALFAGYGADSIFGLFVTRFDGAASAGLKALLPRLSGGAPGGATPN